MRVPTQEDDNNRMALTATLMDNPGCSSPQQIIDYLVERGEYYKARVITELFWEVTKHAPFCLLRD